MDGGGNLLGGKAVDVLAEAGVDEDVEPGDGYDCGYLLLEMAVSAVPEDEWFGGKGKGSHTRLASMTQSSRCRPFR